MAKPKSLRFAVVDSEGKRAASWNVTAAKPPKTDVYLSCREVPGFKVSLHQSGNNHLAYDEALYKEIMPSDHQKQDGRFASKWSKPHEIAPGVWKVFEIVSMSKPDIVDSQLPDYVVRVPPAPQGKVVSFMFFQTDRPLELNGAGFFVGKLPLAHDSTLWVFAGTAERPEMNLATLGRPNYFVGQSEETLEGKNMRLLLFANVEGDGSKLLMDIKREETPL